MKVNLKRLEVVLAWGERSRSSTLFLAYCQSQRAGATGEINQKVAEAAQQLLNSDLGAISRLLEYAKQELKYLESRSWKKCERLFPKGLAAAVIELSRECKGRDPVLSDLGADVNLMTAIAKALKVQLSPEAARKALGKAIHNQ